MAGSPNGIMTDSASPMLGQHLFRMESGELRQSAPTTQEEEFSDESEMEEDVNDPDPTGLPE